MLERGPKKEERTSELHLTVSQEEGLFVVLRDFLTNYHMGSSEVHVMLSDERREQVESLRAIMPKLAEDVGFKGETISMLELMQMGLPNLVSTEKLERFCKRAKANAEEHPSYDNMKLIADMAEYFLKRKKAEERLQKK